MVKGFVFGKFLPFHKGHEAMIQFASTHCDLLTVLPCCSDKELVPAETRVNWIRDAFASNPKIEVKSFEYLESDFPNTSVSSEDVSKIWSDIFKKIFPDYTVLVSSEPYGDYVASYMGIKHILYDIDRMNIPISATAIRNDINSNWSFLPNAVKNYYRQKVVLLGTESTGKSTLTHKLADFFGCSFVNEIGREIISHSNSLNIDDLNRVVIEHAKCIDEVVNQGDPLIIIDTNIFTTMSYAKLFLTEDIDINLDTFRSHEADLYLLMTNEVDFIQDGTRLSESDRNRLDVSLRSILHDFNINFIEIGGDNWDKRFEDAKKHIERFILDSVRHRVAD